MFALFSNLLWNQLQDSALKRVCRSRKKKVFSLKFGIISYPSVISKRTIEPPTTYVLVEK